MKKKARVQDLGVRLKLGMGDRALRQPAISVLHELYHTLFVTARRIGQPKDLANAVLFLMQNRTPQSPTF
ncbi:hypothetical protein QUA82_17790 [Microcoleus sp. F8-D3]